MEEYMKNILSIIYKSNNSEYLNFDEDNKYSIKYWFDELVRAIYYINQNQKYTNDIPTYSQDLALITNSFKSNNGFKLALTVSIILEAINYLVDQIGLSKKDEYYTECVLVVEYAILNMYKASYTVIEDNKDSKLVINSDEEVYLTITKDSTIKEIENKGSLILSCTKEFEGTITNNGKLYIENGTYSEIINNEECKIYSGSYKIFTNNKICTIIDGLFTKINNNYGADLKIEKSSCTDIYNKGSLLIVDGKYYNKDNDKDYILTNEGTVVIDDGSFYSVSKCINNRKETIIINDGLVISTSNKNLIDTYDKDSVIINGGSFGGQVF